MKAIISAILIYALFGEVGLLEWLGSDLNKTIAGVCFCLLVFFITDITKKEIQFRKNKELWQ